MSLRRRAGQPTRTGIRIGALVTVVALVTALWCPVATARTMSSSVRSRSGGMVIPPVTGALFGAVVMARGGQSPTAGFTALEAQLGRKLDTQRVYQSWNDTEPSKTVRWDVANGHLPVISIRTDTDAGAIVPWASIAAGKDDAAIDAQADGLKSLGVPVLLSLNHEPALSPQDGTPADYVAAWQHYVDVFRARGATNVSFVFISGTGSYASGVAAGYYPGDAYVDWIGVDAYNGDGCTSGHGVWSSFGSLVAPFYSFGTSHHKPLIVAEWASVEASGQPGLKAQWITDAASTIASWPSIKAVEYFDGSGVTPSCGWPLTTSSSALAAMKQMAEEPYFNSKPQAVLTASPRQGPAPLHVTFDGWPTISGSSPISSWSLSFGDGSAVLTGAGQPPSVARHWYSAGMFTAHLKVTDVNGETDVAPVTITSYPRPAVVTRGVTGRMAKSVMLTGTVEPLGLDTTYSFEWGTTTPYGSSSIHHDAGSGSKPVRVSVAVSGLQPDTTYHYRLVARNAAGPTNGADETFHTLRSS